jgi:hypothetical protein
MYFLVSGGTYLVSSHVGDVLSRVEDVLSRLVSGGDVLSRLVSTDRCLVLTPCQQKCDVSVLSRDTAYSVLVSSRS